MNESDVSRQLRLKASKKGFRLWRNNRGAFSTPEGNYVRFGLANESPQMDKVIKSSDLIGIKPIVITPDMVGKTIGQFYCREVKHPGWKFRNTPREKAQLAWINLILKLGGDAGFSTHEGDI